MADFEGMFQDRYTRALSMFADAAAQGRDPREILTEMQTNPTYRNATGRGNLPEHRGTGPNTGQTNPRLPLPPTSRIGSGSMTDREFQEYQIDPMIGVSPRIDPMTGVSPTMRPTGSTSDMEFKKYQKDLIDRGPDFGADLKRFAIESGMVDKSEADMLTLEELQALSYQLAPRVRPTSSGATSDMEFKQYMKDALDAAGGGGINALISTPKELLLNLGRKLTGE